MPKKSVETLSVSLERSDANSPRAIIQGEDVLTERKNLKKLFVGEHADFYASLLADLQPKKGIIGVTMKDCYEMALQKPSVYVGNEADNYMARELETRGFTARTVQQKEFDLLLKNLLPPDLTASK